MKIISTTTVTAEFSPQELILIKRVLGKHSVVQYKEYGLTDDDAAILDRIYDVIFDELDPTHI